MGEQAEVKTRTKQVILSKGFVSVEVPVILGEDREDKLMAMLGGQKTLDLANARNRRLEVRFRPEDSFSKAVNLDRSKTNDLLVRVVRKRKKVKPGEVRPPDSFIVEVLGIVGVTYHLRSMCDFQFLPVVRNSNGSFVDVLDNIHPRQVEETDFLKIDVPLFVPPMNFSRIDLPQDFQGKTVIRVDSNYISRTRARRSNHTIFRGFCDQVPTKPILLAAKKLSVKVVSQEEIDMVKQKFNEKPIWSKTELMHAMERIPADKLKYILPVVAYYFQTGPWRTLWVRFGYDPVKEPSARIDQIIDYRLRHGLRVGTAQTFDVKRSGANTITLDRQRKQHRRKAQGPVNVSEDYFLIKPGIIPPGRQMLYQLRHIQIAEAQEKIRSVRPTAECTEKYGWLPPKFDDEIRQLIVETVKTTVSSETKGEAVDAEASGAESGSDLEGEDEELSDEEDLSGSSDEDMEEPEES